MISTVIGEIIDKYVSTTVVRSRLGGKQRPDASCRRSYDAKQTAYRDWRRALNAEHWGQIVLASAETYRPSSRNIPTKGMFLLMFLVVDLETSNGLMPAAGEFMMINRLLTVTGVLHAKLIIRVNLCFARDEAQSLWS